MGVFSTTDYKYAESLGIDSISLDRQWGNLNKGFQTVILNRPAIIKDGIKRLSPEEEAFYIHYYKQEKSNYSILKFVPASGAASRMFLPFREMRDNPTSNKAKMLLDKITSFPFYENILSEVEIRGIDIDVLKEDPKKMADFILGKSGLNYDSYPKGLVTFHRDEENYSSAFQQQLMEAEYLCDSNIHFTVSDSFLNEIKDSLNEEKASFSIQNPSTHFIAKVKNEPLRGDDNNLVFRPSGHGALLKNLNAIDADIVFIKNIDNIQIPKKNGASLKAKEVLGGYLIKIKQQIDTFLFQLEEDKDVNLNEISDWIKENIDSDVNLENKTDLIRYLHRPIRIAGMVLNEGKAGGGPFWVKGENGNNVQIVEGAQINKKEEEQVKILESSTHFNPVDLACSLVDHRGKKYDLEEFVDPDSGFLSSKVIDGNEVTIMERPGLWNGSMSDWISIFLELPLESFTPVKTVMDLLPESIK